MAPINPFEDDKPELLSIFKKLEKLSKEIDDLNIDDLDSLLTNIKDEIEADKKKMSDLQQNGNVILWMYKDFESEKDCNSWLEVFSEEIVEIRPTAKERLSFYVKLYLGD